MSKAKSKAVQARTAAADDGTTAATAATVQLRDRLIEAAAAILQEEGYARLSMRRVAERADCSQMAMYRHFKDKNALTEYLCAAIYMRFAESMHGKTRAIADPRERLLRFVSGLIEFASSHPDQYSLIFLTRPADGSVFEQRQELGKELLTGMRDGLRQILPRSTSAAEVDRCLLRILFCLHGAAALLMAHPKVYGLTEKRAIREARRAVQSLLDDAGGAAKEEAAAESW